MIIETVFLGVWQDLGRSEELNNVKAGAESILGRCILLLPKILKISSIIIRCEDSET